LPEEENKQKKIEESFAMSNSEKIGYFTVGKQNLYTVYYPDNTKTNKGNILLLQPFGEEKKCVLRMLVLLARKAANNGYNVMHFDFSGTGDSSGKHQHANLDQWLNEAKQASKLLQQTNNIPLTIIGVRLASLLALELAKQLKTYHQIILLEPIKTGQEAIAELIRRQQIKEMMTGNKGKSETEILSDWNKNQTIELSGYMVNAKLANQLQKLDLNKTLQQLPPYPTICIIKTTPNKKFPTPWQPIVKTITNRTNSQAITIKEKPFWGQLEYYESTIIPKTILEFITTTK